MSVSERLFRRWRLRAGRKWSAKNERFTVDPAYGIIPLPGDSAGKRGCARCGKPLELSFFVLVCTGCRRKEKNCTCG
jgi:hypothetical protein